MMEETLNRFQPRRNPWLRVTVNELERSKATFSSKRLLLSPFASTSGCLVVFASVFSVPLPTVIFVASAFRAGH
jgi:hypothetical protein